MNLYPLIYGLVRTFWELATNRSYQKDKTRAEAEASKETNPIFFVEHEDGRFPVYNIFIGRYGKTTFFVKSNEMVFNLLADDCEIDEFCPGGKEKLADMLSGSRMSNDRMDDLRFLCNSIGLSEADQDEIREIIINDYE